MTDRDPGMSDFLFGPGVSTGTIDEETVQVEIDEKGSLWVNIGGRCRLRVKGHFKLIVDDQRTKARRKA